MKKFLQIDGRRVALEVEGYGKPLLMLHGWGGSKESWEPLMAAFKMEGVLQHSMAVAMDFPGFGESEDPPTPWNVNDYARFVEKLIDELYKQLDLNGDFDVIVHSFGGRVILKLLSPDFAHQITQKTDRLILVAAAGIKPARTWKVRLASSLVGAGKKFLNIGALKSIAPLAKRILYKLLGTHDYEQSSGVMRATFLRVIDEDLKSSLDHIKNPTLIFWGQKDSYVPLRDGEYMQMKIPGSKLIVFSDGKHGIHKTKAALLAQEISKFLKNHV